MNKMNMSVCTMMQKIVVFKMFFIIIYFLTSSLDMAFGTDHAIPYPPAVIEKRIPNKWRGPKGSHGKRGHQGNNGAQGVNGAAGPSGAAGSTGATGPTGASEPAIQPFQYDLFVDHDSISLTPDGSISNPYPTINAALAQVQGIASAPNVTYTLLIAGGTYNEDVVVNQAGLSVSGPAIALVPLSDVVVTSFTWNYDAAQTHPCVAIRTIDTHTSDPIARFIITSTCTIDAGNSNNGFGLFEMSAKVGGAMTTASIGFDNTIYLNLYNCDLQTISTVASSVRTILLSAENCTFNGLVSVASYGRIQACDITSGMTIQQAPSNSLFGFTPNTSLGIFSSRCAGVFQPLAPSPAHFFYVDPATHYWFHGTPFGGSPASVNNAANLVVMQ